MGFTRYYGHVLNVSYMDRINSVRCREDSYSNVISVISFGYKSIQYNQILLFSRISSFKKCIGKPAHALMYSKRIQLQCYHNSLLCDLKRRLFRFYLIYFSNPDFYIRYLVAIDGLN